MDIESRVMPNIVVFDIETGGFSGSKNPLVEVCFICYDGVTLEEIDRYEAIIAPHYENPLTKEPLEYTTGALNIHKISIAMMEEVGKALKVVAQEVIAKLKLWKVKGMMGKPILGGHNILKFDIPFIKTSFSFVKEDVNFEKAINAQKIDSMYFSTFQFPSSKDKGDTSAVNVNHKLGSICKALGISLVGAHRASTDTEANAKVIIKWIKSMRGEGTAVASSGLENQNESDSFKF